MRFDLFLSRARAIAIILMCGAVTWAAIAINKSLTPALGKVGSTADQLTTDLKTVDTNLGHLDARLNGDAGLIPEAARAAHGVNATLARVNGKDGALENLVSVERTLNDTIVDVHSRLTNKDGILPNVDAAMRDVRVNLVQASRAQTKVDGQLETQAQELTNLIKTADKLLTDASPTLKNMADASQNTASITGHVDAIAADLQGSIHKSLHPSKGKLIGSGLWTAVKLAISHGIP